jgi:hypothetical protein
MQSFAQECWCIQLEVHVLVARPRESHAGKVIRTLIDINVYRFPEDPHSHSKHDFIGKIAIRCRSEAERSHFGYLLRARGPQTHCPHVEKRIKDCRIRKMKKHGDLHHVLDGRSGRQARLSRLILRFPGSALRGEGTLLNILNTTAGEIH